jgi:hypothetical protein
LRAGAATATLVPGLKPENQRRFADIKVRPGVAPSEQRDQECHQTDRNGDHDHQHDEAPAAGDQFSELPLTRAGR